MHWSYVLPPMIMGLLGLLGRHHLLRRRPGNIPVRVRQPGQRRWRRGHAVWVHDVFAFRASPAAWHESLDWVAAVSRRVPTPAEGRKLHRFAADAAVGTLRLHDGGSVDVAARGKYARALFNTVVKPGEVVTSPDVLEPS